MDNFGVNNQIFNFNNLEKIIILINKCKLSNDNNNIKIKLDKNKGKGSHSKLKIPFIDKPIILSLKMTNKHFYKIFQEIEIELDKKLKIQEFNNNKNELNHKIFCLNISNININNNIIKLDEIQEKIINEMNTYILILIY